MRRPGRTGLAFAGLLALTGGLAAPAMAAPGRPSAGPARFEVGAAVTSITPPLSGALADDPANCTAGTPAATVFNGPRQFAFEDPYVDGQHVGHYVPGDPYVDCAHVGRWVGNLLGGGANSPRFYDHVADRTTARALAVSNGRRTVAVEVLDNEGVFNVYVHRVTALVRAWAASRNVHVDGIFVSSTHDESAPDTIGLGGVNSAVSGTNPFYVDFMVKEAALAIEDALQRMQPARIRYAQATEPANLRQCWSSYPFVDDQLIPVLQAVGRSGDVIATLGDVSQHAETLGFNPNPAQAGWISADWPHFFRQALQRAYGGVAIEMAGSVGSVETPEVYSGAIAPTPQELSVSNHPAGCRTVFDPNGSREPVGYHHETTLLGQELAAAVEQSLSTSARWSRSNAIWGQREPVCITLTNDLFLAAAAAGVFAERPGYTADCRVEVPPAANGTTAGNEVQSDVAAFRIGDATFASVPGEAFPVTFLGGFLGPADYQYPQYGIPPMLMAYMHTPYRFIVGLGEDMLGYMFPQGNGVGVPGEHPLQNTTASSTDRFGCAHSDDSEATGSATANVVGSALAAILRAHGGPPEPIQTGRYVMPGGALSRDPLGNPESIQCDTNTVFHPTGPAAAVWVPGGGVVVPAAWMDLAGRPQRGPDRNTRGWIGPHGGRHWLNVFPHIPGAPAAVT
ncbi:MAG TPA: hypothetical protein VFP54_02375 [Acidimicrobiales bacterium]|nr:hypothetical protein [Acidimicrobiales bacterium]